MPLVLRSTLARYLAWIRSFPARLAAARRAFSTDLYANPLAIYQDGPFQVLYRKGTADEQVLQHSFSKDIFFPALPEYRPRPDHIVVDVGAHIGTFTLLAARYASNGKVFAIEASEQSATILIVNVALNHLDNVHVDHLALAGEKGVAFLYHDTLSGNWGHTITKKLSAHREQVASDNLSNYFSEHGISFCHLMKLNCEGAEFDIILRSPRELLQRVGLFLILYHSDMVEGHDHRDLSSHLEKAGFRTRVLEKSGTRGWLIAEKVSP